MTYIFGPVPSRRLGLSLGVDLVPFKTCTYDCVYCQVGKTTHKTIECRPYVPIVQVIDELKKNLENTCPDTITLAGSGEPTLNSQIKEIISFIKTLSGIRIAVITNGSMLWKEEIRDSIIEADIIMPTLTTAYDKTFKRIHRPCNEIQFQSVLRGLKKLREIYDGRYWLEIMLIAGMNESADELEALKSIVEGLCPDRIQLNSVVRPPSDPSAQSLDGMKLEKIKKMFGENAEIISSTRLKQEKAVYDSHTSMILEMVRRRPVSAIDISSILGVEESAVHALIKGLLIKGILEGKEHGGVVYYSIKKFL